MEIENKIITLRNVYGKMKEVHFQPCRQKNGARFPFVKPVRYDSLGNAEMILSQDELNDPEREYFVPEDLDIIVNDGTTFDLSNPMERNVWLSIRESDLIAPSRDTKDSNGDYVIDGNRRRYGMAEFYVDIPGEQSRKSVNKKQKITKAWTYIEKDTKNGRLTKCKILGKIMDNAPDSDVEDYLYQRAESNPTEIIELYESKDVALKLLIIDAKTKGVIIKKDGMYVYGDTILGATDESIMISFKNPINQKVRDQVAFETYPEYAPISQIEAKVKATEKEPVAKTSKKN